MAPPAAKPNARPAAIADKRVPMFMFCLSRIIEVMVRCSLRQAIRSYSQSLFLDSVIRLTRAPCATILQVKLTGATAYNAAVAISTGAMQPAVESHEENRSGKEQSPENSRKNEKRRHTRSILGRLRHGSIGPP